MDRGPRPECGHPQRAGHRLTLGPAFVGRLYDFKSSNGRRLKQAYEKIAEWNRNLDSFAYWKGDPTKLTGVRYSSYFEILNTQWANDDASKLLGRYRPMTANHSAPFLIFTHGTPLTRGFEHPGGLHSRSQIETAWEKIALCEQPWIAAYKVLIQQATEGLKKASAAVLDFNVPVRYRDAKGHREVMADAGAGLVFAAAIMINDDGWSERPRDTKALNAR